MRYQKSGSAVLLVVLVLSTVLIFLSSGWYTTQSVLEIVTNKKRMFEARYTSKGLLDYAILACCNNYDELVQQGEEKEFSLDASQWPFKNKKYVACISIKPKGDNLKVTVRVDNSDKSVQSKSCLISYKIYEKDVSKSFFIVTVV